MQESTSQRTGSIRLTSGAIALAICLLAIQIPIAFGATSVESVEGSAYGVYASVDLVLVKGTLGSVPSVVLPEGGGEVSKTKASARLTVGLTEIVDLGLLEVSSTASGVGGSDGNVKSIASVNGTDILGGIIHANEVTAVCSADTSGAKGHVTLAGASVAGVGALKVSPAPNTGISIPGVGSLVLNKQTKSSDGTLTVTGLSLSLLPVLGTGTVNIARAVCGAETSTVTTPTTVPPTTPTTESPTTTAPQATTTTAPPPATTTTAPAQSTTTSEADDSNEDSDSELEDSESEDSESEDDENFCVDPEQDTSVSGLAIERSGGPPSAGLAAASPRGASDASRTVPEWPLMVVFTVLGTLIGSAGMMIDWKRLDIRRLIGRAPVS